MSVSDRKAAQSRLISIALVVVLAVLALVFGYRARREIENSAGSQTGSGLATAGIILGWIGITILVAGVVLISFHPLKH